MSPAPKRSGGIRMYRGKVSQTRTRRLLLVVAVVAALMGFAPQNADAHGAAYSSQPVTWPAGWQAPVDRDIRLNTQHGVFGPGCPNHSHVYYEQYVGSLQHLGLDIAANDTNTVLPIADGTVVNAGVGNIWQEKWEGVVIVRHAKSTGEKFTAVYAHITIGTNPRTGQKWKGGDSILASDTLGKVGSLNHLHFGIVPAEVNTIAGSSGNNCQPLLYGTVDPLIFLAGSDSGGGGGGGDDNLPPPDVTISGGKSPAANGFGWNNTDVTVSFSCGGGVPDLTCTGPSTLTTEGTHTVTGSVVDEVGQTKSDSVIVKIDKTKPTVTLGATGANEAGWYKAKPTLTGGCTDALSDIATCADPTASSSSFVGTLTRTGTDKAGNSASASIDIKIDTKPPTITPSMVPDLNENGWSRTDDRIVVFFDCEDPLENGVASGLETDTCPVPQAVLKVGVTPITVSATDVAGNTTTITTYVRIDRTAPTLTIVPDREPDTEEGWYTDPVTLSGDCDDTESPILDCTEEAVEEDGIHTVWLFAENAADFITSRKTTIKMDINGPEIEPVFTGTMGSNGYFTTSVGVSFVCTDAGIGVKTCPKKKQISKDGVTHIEATATDKLGHESTIIFDLIIDKTKPKGTITKLTKNTVAPGGLLKGTVGDAFSGVGDAYLEIANGNGTALIDVVRTCNSGNTSCTWTANALSQPGSYTMKLAVIDQAGNVYRTSAYRFTIK